MEAFRSVFCQFGSVFCQLCGSATTCPGAASDACASPDATVAARVPQGSRILFKLLMLLHLRCGSLTRTHTLLVWSPMKCPLSRRELFGCTKCPRYSNLTQPHPHPLVARRVISYTTELVALASASKALV